MNNYVSKRVVKSTSRKSAVCSDIELNVTSTTKLIFRPEIVNNPHDQKACVKGTFIHYRKNKSDMWEKLDTYPRSSIPAGCAINLSLDTAETMNLIEGLSEFKNAYDKDGIPYGEKEYLITSKSVGQFAEQLANLDNAKTVIESLTSLNSNVLDNLGTVLGISRLKMAIQIWKDNQASDNEEYWHKIFRDNFWLVAQLLLHPVIILNDKAYVGGKGTGNTGANIADFLLQNKLTTNVLILEIKTPTTQLLASQYRSIYPVSRELSGAITQALNYKQELLNNFFSLAQGRKLMFESFDPKCVVIIGNLAELDTRDKLRSFEIFRNQLTNVEIVTYNELFEKTHDLLVLLTTEIN